MFVPRNQPVIDALDRCALWIVAPIERVTGIKVYQSNPAARRHRAFVWLPAALMVVSFAGFAALITGHEIIGWIMVCLSQSASIALSQVSTVTEGIPHPDERQRELSRNGHFRGLQVLAALTVGGCVYAGLAQPNPRTDGQSILNLLTGHDWWMPTGPLSWLSIAMLLIAVETNVAIIAASLATPRGDFGED